MCQAGPEPSVYVTPEPRWINVAQSVGQQTVLTGSLQSGEYTPMEGCKVNHGIMY